MLGDVSLHFANTAEWHAGPNPEERLTSYEHVVEWGQREHLLSATQAERLIHIARAQPAQAREALRRIVALREAVYHIFSAVARRALPESSDLETLNAEFAQAASHQRLVKTDGSPLAGNASPTSEGLPEFQWEWTGVEDQLTSPLWPVARDAAELLTSRSLSQVRECADDTCGWLFMDLSKNASRRWCNMADCGNRAKARRYRARKKGASTPPQGPGEDSGLDAGQCPSSGAGCQ